MDIRHILNKLTPEGWKAIEPGNTCLQYSGRIDFAYGEGPLFVFPSSYVKIRFIGTGCRAVVTNIRACWNNDIGYLVDGKECRAPLPGERRAVCLTLAEGLPETEHEITLFKRMDSCHELVFHGFIIDSSAVLMENEPLPERRIEVYGDSVSAGEVSEAVAYCGMPDPEHNGEYSNSYYSYAWLTARRLHAQLHNIAQGGISLLDGTGYFGAPDYKGIISIYDKIEYHPELEPVKEWDFALYRPQAVIVAIGQNDSNPEDYMAADYNCDKAVHWRQAYAGFLAKLRVHYPDAHIICKTTILNHHANWDTSIEEVCRSSGDDKVHYFRYSNNSVGTPGHIRIPEAEKMAEELAAYMERTVYRT